MLVILVVKHLSLHLGLQSVLPLKSKGKTKTCSTKKQVINACLHKGVRNYMKWWFELNKTLSAKKQVINENDQCMGMFFVCFMKVKSNPLTLWAKNKSILNEDLKWSPYNSMLLKYRDKRLSMGWNRSPQSISIYKNLPAIDFKWKQTPPAQECYTTTSFFCFFFWTHPRESW